MSTHFNIRPEITRKLTALAILLGSISLLWTASSARAEDPSGVGIAAPGGDVSATVGSTATTVAETVPSEVSTPVAAASPPPEPTPPPAPSAAVSKTVSSAEDVVKVDAVVAEVPPASHAVKSVVAEVEGSSSAGQSSSPVAAATRQVARVVTATKTPVAKEASDLIERVGATAATKQAGRLVAGAVAPADPLPPSEQGSSAANAPSSVKVQGPAGLEIPAGSEMVAGVRPSPLPSSALVLEIDRRDYLPALPSLPGSLRPGSRSALELNDGAASKLIAGSDLNLSQAATTPRNGAPVPSVPVPLPAPSPGSSGFAPGGAGTYFVPLLLGLVALVALSTPGVLRRLRSGPVMCSPALFVCALERPG